MPENNKTYRLFLPMVPPGDFGVSGIAVWSEDYRKQHILISGDTVMPCGDAKISIERDADGKIELVYQLVKCENGFIGRVCWDIERFHLADA